ncbi:unnamed protein product [Allacma fusca]|uniref:Carboxylesterase type B domain-containing protein n=1 Tax=Allacma fusca TaxID=39272 RepID=A0A8J2JQ26_9HEXA|nr:unnamed protein product [Allacma fusca]
MRGRTITPAVLLLGSIVYFTSTLNHWIGNGGSSHVIVKTNLGSLRGVREVSRGGRNYYEFRGIPYAKPPLGTLRFESPEKPEPWTGVRDATSYGSTCLQYEYLTKILQGSENCLFLNVASPHHILSGPI